MKPTEENDIIRQTLQQAMPDDLPPALEQRMQNRFAAFRQHADAKSPAPGFLSIRRLLPGKLVGWTTAVITTAVLLVAMLFLPQAWHSTESFAWADVVQAVAKKPWLHYVATYDEGTKMEAWFSARRAVLIARVIKAGTKSQVGGDSEGRMMIDLSQNTRDWYDPEENLIVRTTDDPFREGADPTVAIFSAFLSGNLERTIDAGRFQLVPQQPRVVVEGGKRWIEHRLIPQGKNENAMFRSEWIISVDPDTQLPFRWEQATSLVSDPSKVHVGARREIDYPPTGPEDIYALGVPKTAKIVDRTLRSDVERLAKEAVAPNHWADDRFSALVVKSGWKKQQWWQGQSIYRVWKDGLRWRVDHSMGHVTEPFDKPPPPNTEPAEWWRQKAKRFPFRPESLCDGRWYREYETKTRSPTPADTAAGWPKDTMAIVSIKISRKNPVQRDHFRVEDPLGWGRPMDPINYFQLIPGFETSVDPKPKSGPPNTVLLETRDPNWKPFRNFIVLRYGDSGSIQCETIW